MEKKFTNHLIDIGFIDKKTESQILLMHRQKNMKYNTKFKFNELMTEILLSLMNNLTEIQKKYICFHLPVKFIKLSNKLLKDKLRNIIYKKILKTKIILWKYFFKWYKSYNKYKIFIANNNKKNIFRQKKNQANVNTKNDYLKNNINENIRDFLFNSYYNTNLSTLNNGKKSKTQNELRKQSLNSNKTPKKFQIINDKNFINFNPNDKNTIKNNMPNNTNNIGNKDITNNITITNNYLNRIKKNSYICSKQCSNNNTQTSGFRDSLESNENCLSTNLNTINNRYNNQDNNKTLSQSEFISNYDLMNAYIIKTNKKLTNNNSVSTSKSIITSSNKYYNQYNKNKKRKIRTKNKSIIIQNLLKDNNEKNNSSLSSQKNIKQINKNSNNSNIYNLIYYNNYNNLNQNNNDNLTVATYQTYQTPFCETVTHSKSTKNSACKRLFEDGKRRIKKYNEKRREQEKILDEMACGVSGEKKNVDYNRINELYKNKEKINTLEKVKNKVEKEEGLTFKPMISKDEYIQRIYGDFIERNISNKSNDNKCCHEYSNNCSKKKMTKKQKDKIVIGVINRLYSNSLIKSMSTYCNKYTKGINQQYNLKPYKKKL